MTDEERKKVRNMIVSCDKETRVLGMILSSSDIEWLLSLRNINYREDFTTIDFDVMNARRIHNDEYVEYPDLVLFHNGKYYKYKKFSSYIGIFSFNQITKQEYDRGTKNINWKDDSE